MLPAIILLLSVCALPSWGAENLIVNGDFSAGLEGWSANRPETQPALDAEQFRSAPASLRVPSTAERVGMMTPLIELPEPLPNALTISGWVRADAVDDDTSIGFDLRIILDDGSETWFFPEALQVQADEVGEWVRKFATYVAPTGHTIAATAAFCLNYRSEGANAWFDDVALSAQTAVGATREIVVLRPELPDGPAETQFAGRPADELPAVSDFGAAKLVVVPEWIEDESVYFRLKIFHYLGGRVILYGLPEEYYARGLSRYLWNAPPSELTEAVTLSEDGRAAHVAAPGEVDLDALVARLLATEIALPDEVPELDCGPKPPIELRGGALYVGDEPLLWRAMGTYAVDGVRPIEQHRASFAHYARDLHLNGFVLYLDYQTDPEHLREVLDAAWAEGLRAIVWIRGPAVTSYSEKPLKDEWLLRFMPLRSHPAWLGWEIADDTWYRHLEFVECTSQLIRRYDTQNLVTTTVMDLRRPERLSEEEWARYRSVLDYPLTYLYPLQKGRTFGGGADIEGGLEDVQRLAEQTRAYWGEDAYIQQWCQAHMQGPSYPKVGIPPRSTYVPTPEQQRLLTYMMLTSGTRGIAYFSSYGLADDRLGMGRRAELGLLWGELAPVEDIIAGGRITACETSDASVEANAFTLGDETVVLAVKHGAEYHRYVDDATVQALAITLPEGARCVQLDGPEASLLSLEGRTVRLPMLDVSAALLITASGERMSALEAQRAEWAPLCARLALSAAADTAAKTRVVAERLGPLATEEFRRRVAAGDAAFEEVLASVRKGAQAEAWRQSRVALRHWREAQAIAIRAAESEHARLGLGEDALPPLNIYPALPNFAHRYLGAPEPDYAAMHDEIQAWLGTLEGLVREPLQP